MNRKDSKSPRNPVATHILDAPRSGIREFFDIVSTRKDIISLSIGEPDFVTPWHIREASSYALDHGATNYTSNRGLESLRREISGYVNREFGVLYDPTDEVLITVGVSEALDLAIRAITEPGDEILYHEPCYVCYAPLVSFAHGKPVSISTRGEDGFRLTRAMLEQKVSPRTKALILNFPTNPTGAVLDRKNMAEIAAFAVEHDLVVLTDEIYSELTYEGERTSIASFPGMKQRTVFLHGFSKGWAMTGFRLGYACAPAGIIDAMTKIHQYTILCAPILSQKAAIEALRNSGPDVIEMRNSYEQRRNYMLAAFKDMGISCHKPRGAFYMFPQIAKFGMSSKDFTLKLLDEQKVACVPGSAFGPAGEGYMRCAYATDIEEIKEAMKRIAAFISKL